MRLTRIITAKIKPRIYELIVAGVKRFEVRDESFHHADYIRFLSADSGDLLGVYELGAELRFDRTEPDVNGFIRSLSGISAEKFDDMFPFSEPFRGMKIGARYLYVAGIGARIIDLNGVFDITPTAAQEKQ